MKDNAIILTGDILNHGYAKTAHGLIRGTSRYNIVAVIDEKFYGRDAGEVAEGIHRGIPVYSDISEFKKHHSEKIKYCIIGIATHGGHITDEIKKILKEAILNGYSLVNPLHEFLSENEELKSLAESEGVELIDTRKPRDKSRLKFWTGKILEVEVPIVAVLGTDCMAGKRTTTILLRDELRKKGYKAEMIYTGQTGWLLGEKYGFILDATHNDFVSGELENAIYNCYKEASPDIILVEGQSSLMNPSGPCGAEIILSGEAKAVILAHPPDRIKFDGLEHIPENIPEVEDEIILISKYGAETLGVVLNTMHIDGRKKEIYRKDLERKIKLPVVYSLEEGVQRLLPPLIDYMNNFRK